MNFQQTRKIKPPKLAILLILFTGFCTFVTLYSPSFQKQSSETEASIDNLHDPIRTTELIEQSDLSNQEKFNDSSTADKKSLEETTDDAAAYNSSLSEDIKSLEEDNFLPYTTPNWPDITVEDLIKKEEMKVDSTKNDSSEGKKEVSQNKDDSKKESEKYDSFQANSSSSLDDSKEESEKLDSHQAKSSSSLDDSKEESEKLDSHQAKSSSLLDDSKEESEKLDSLQANSSFSLDDSKKESEKFDSRQAKSSSSLDDSEKESEKFDSRHSKSSSSLDDSEKESEKFDSRHSNSSSWLDDSEKESEKFDSRQAKSSFSLDDSKKESEKFDSRQAKSSSLLDDSEKESEKFDSRQAKSSSSPGKSLKGGSKKQNRTQDQQSSQGFPSALVSSVADKKSCDIFSGEWVPNLKAPYYTNRTCKHIQEHQNCMKFGKPDKGYMKWKWKPANYCELPLFDPHHFLELLRGKSIAFVGDSVARNHMQSLLCLLSQAVVPKDISKSKDENFKQFQFPKYNFTISIFWAPYLVRSERTDLSDATRPFRLFLDEPDEYWPSQIKSYNYILLSAGQWFFRPTMFYLNRTLVGCLYCADKNVTHLSSTFGYRKAFRTAFSAINNLKHFKGVTFLRTFATSHFEGGPWNKGGDCVRTKPLHRNESAIEEYGLALYKIQLEELRIAQREGLKKGLKFRLFDATRPMSLRPDGHPGKYGHSPKQKVELANDCVHWCLPGPIDTLNDFLQELITRELEPTSS